MSEQVTLKVNGSKETEFEFDVQIQGLSEETANASEVRFAIIGINGMYDVSVRCSPTPSGKWHVLIPCLQLTSVEQPFKIEVIVDGYYFVPVQGNLIVISEPRIDMSSSIATAKPLVSATFIQTEIEVIEGKTPTKTRRLLESNEMSANLRKEVASKVLITSKLLSKAGAMLENCIDGSNLNNKVIAGTLSTVRQAIDMVEIKVYVEE